MNHEPLKKAMEPFITFMNTPVFNSMPDNIQMTMGSNLARRQLTVGDFKALREALLGLTSEQINTGARFKKITGDYGFEGECVSIFCKRSGAIRYVLEDDRGLLFIFNPSQLHLVTENQP